MAPISQNTAEGKKNKEKSTISILETVQQEGNRTVKRKLTHYNLDMILSVGYRVNSMNATSFRKWVTKTLLSKREKGVDATIYTASISPQFQLDLQKHNAQYPTINVKTFTLFTSPLFYTF
jgi:hypothetical protein